MFSLHFLPSTLIFSVHHFFCFNSQEADPAYTFHLEGWGEPRQGSTEKLLRLGWMLKVIYSEGTINSEQKSKLYQGEELKSSSGSKVRPKECGGVVNRRLYNEVISQKDQKHMGYIV